MTTENTLEWITMVPLCALAAYNQDHNYGIATTCQLEELNRMLRHNNKEF